MKHSHSLPTSNSQFELQDQFGSMCSVQQQESWREVHPECITSDDSTAYLAFNELTGCRGSTSSVNGYVGDSPTVNGDVRDSPSAHDDVRDSPSENGDVGDSPSAKDSPSAHVDVGVGDSPSENGDVGDSPSANNDVRDSPSANVDVGDTPFSDIGVDAANNEPADIVGYLAKVSTYTIVMRVLEGGGGGGG